MSNGTDKTGILIAPSILSADFTRLKEALDLISQSGGDWVHVDVMDGHYVPNLTIGPPVLASIRRETDLFLDVHLMIEDPDRLIPSFIQAGASMITVHAEACKHLNRTLQSIREAGIKAGIALNPATSLSALDYSYDATDMILLMTVNPGFGGQTYIPEMTGKIRQLRGMIRLKNPNILLQIDGGINTANIAEVTAAGANVIVTGSSFFSAPDPAGYVRELRDLSEYRE
jgi:ribulose-phosphate 3-epimerase